MGLLDLVTGGKSSDASDALEKALEDIQAVKTPTTGDLSFQIQQLVQEGVLTPEQAKTFLQNPSAFSTENIDQTGTGAQKEAIAGLLSRAKEGGLNPTDQAKISQIMQDLGTQERGANEAVVQNQAERGALTGGETLAAQLEGNQTADIAANQAGLGTAAASYQAMLDELTSAGNMGQGLQSQENTQANTVAAATDAINKFNATQQQQEENYNVGNRNTAEAQNLSERQRVGDTNVGNANTHAQYEANLPQQVYEDEIAKAEAEAGVRGGQANLDTTQGGQEAGLIGNLVGTGGQIAAAGMAKPPTTNIYTGSEGGEVHDYREGGEVEADQPEEEPVVKGNSPRNDKIPAFLSKNEIVLPRTVTAHPSPDKVMAFLNRIRQKKEAPPPVHPADTAHVLKALSLMRGHV